MTSLLGVRKRAEEFADAVDGSSSSPRPEVVDLLALVAALRSQPEVRPSTDFSTALRTRLVAEAERRPSHASLVLPPRPRGARERRLVAVASAVVLIGGSAGMAAAAQDALPGQALYPIKRGIEHAQAGLSFSAAAKGHRLLDQADDRLVEVQALLEDPAAHQSPQLADTITDFTDQAAEGSQLLLDSFQDTGDESKVAAVHRFATSGMAALADLAADAPVPARARLRDAALALAQVDRAAADACSSCSTTDLKLPAIFLVSAEVDRALDRVQKAATAPDNSHPVRVDGTVVKEAAKHGLHRAGTHDGATPGGSSDSSGDQGSTTPGTVQQGPGLPATTPRANPTGPAAGSSPRAGGLPTPSAPLPTGGLPSGLLGGVGDALGGALGDTLGGATGGLLGDTVGGVGDPSSTGGPSSSGGDADAPAPGGGLVGGVVGTLLPHLGLQHP